MVSADRISAIVFAIRLEIAKMPSDVRVTSLENERAVRPDNGDTVLRAERPNETIAVRPRSERTPAALALERAAERPVADNVAKRL